MSIPFLEKNPITGLEIPDIGKVLREHLVQRPNGCGFAINNYTIRNDPFDFNSMFNFGNMMQERKAKFIFDKRVITENGISYFEYTLKLTYTPKEEGSHTFGPAIFKGMVITGVDQTSRGIRSPVFAVGPAVTVRVIPPPEEGRPVSYIGAIGSNITAEALIDVQTCKVGDPLNLTIGISGNTRLDNINPPILNLQTNLTKHFKIYEDTVQTSLKEGKKNFVYTIRPTMTGTLEFPPIEIAYFDSGSRSYRTIKTQPIPIRANESLEIGAANIIETVTNRTAEAKKTAEQDSLIIAPIDINPAGTIPDKATLEQWEVVVLVTSPIIYFAVAGISLIRRRLRLGERTRMRNRAVNEAFLLLRDCENMSKNNPSNASIILCTAIKKYLANRFDAVEAGLTPSDARKLLEQSGINTITGNNLCDLLERNFNAAYSSHSTVLENVTEDCRQAHLIIQQIENTFKISSPAKRSGILPLLIVFSVIMNFAKADTFVPVYVLKHSIARNSPVEFQFLWNEANSKMSSSSSPEDFAAAAAVYRKLIDVGVRNGVVFYNLGTALLKARQYDDALRALQRAERYSGSNEDIRHNMFLAIAGKEKNPNVSLPWYRVPLFWHYSLSISNRIALATCAFAVFWLALTIRALGSTRTYRPLMSVALILLIVLASSVVTSLQQEEKDSRSYPHIIFDPRQYTHTEQGGTTNTLPVSGEGWKP
ncbi:MAG: BatD family protein [Kiritimatiellae bacterium]|nr:BatD family protein [Kiritimatiellia bacterium]